MLTLGLELNVTVLYLLARMILFVLTCAVKRRRDRWAGPRYELEESWDTRAQWGAYHRYFREGSEIK